MTLSTPISESTADLVVKPFTQLLTSSDTSQVSQKPGLTETNQKKRRRWLKSTLEDGSLLKQVGEVKHELERQVNAQESAIHQSMISNLPDLSSHFHTARDLQQRIRETEAGVSELERALGETESLATPLVSLLHSRSSLLRDQSTSISHLLAIKQLSKRTARLKAIELAVDDGQVCWEKFRRDAEGSELFWVAHELESDKSSRTGRGISPALKNSKVWKVLDQKAIELHRRESQQVSEGLEAALSVTSAPGGTAEIDLKGLDHIQLGRSRSSTGPKSTETKTTRVAELICAAYDFSLLEQHLNSFIRQLHDQILRPIVQGSKALIVCTGFQDDAILHFSSPPNQASEEKESNFSTIAKTIETVFDFLLRRLGPICTDDILPEPPQAILLDLLENTIRQTFEDLHASRLLKSMPIDTQDLPRWFRDVTIASKLEEAISNSWWIHLKNARPSSFRKLQDFGTDQAGIVWATARRAEMVDRIRSLVCGNWENWEAVEIKRERRMEQNAVQGKEEGTKDGQPAIAIEGSPKEAKKEDGWAFGDTWDQQTSESSAMGAAKTDSSPLPSPENGFKPSSAKDNNEDTDEDGGGWAFDDEEDKPAPKPVAPVKPIREAKRIGKKAKSQAPEETSTPTKSPSIPSPVSVETEATVPPSGDGWNDDWETPLVTEKKVEGTSPPQPVPIIDTFYISSAVHTLLTAIEDALKYASTLNDAKVVDHDLSRMTSLLQNAAAEGLDLYRALMPVVHAGQVRDIPALAMQFHNDCRELALKAVELEEQYRWDSKDCASKLEALANFTFDNQIRMQEHALLELLAKVNELDQISDQAVFVKDERIMEEIKHSIEVLHRVWSVSV